MYVQRRATEAREAGVKNPSGVAGDRRIAKALASQNRSETIAYCADYLERVISHTCEGGKRPHGSNPTSRLTRSQAKLAIVMQEREKHRVVLETALPLIINAERATQMNRIAAAFMLEELKGGDYNAILSVPANEKEITRERSRVEDIAADVRHLKGLIANLSPDPLAEQWAKIRFDWSISGTALGLKRALGDMIRLQTLKLAKSFGTLYVLGKSEPSSPIVTGYLELMSSNYGRRHPLPADAKDESAFQPDNLCMVAASFMLPSDARKIE